MHKGHQSDFINEVAAMIEPVALNRQTSAAGIPV